MTTSSPNSKTSPKKTVPTTKAMNLSLSYNAAVDTTVTSPARRAALDILSPRSKLYTNNSTAGSPQNSYSFAHGERFTQDKPIITPHAYNLDSPSQNNKKGFSMGIGGRSNITGRSKEALAYPSPGGYQLKSDFDNSHKRGRSFGLPYSAYQNVYVPGSKEVRPAETKHLPGPGEYSVVGKPGADMPMIGFKPKGKMFNEEKIERGPNLYTYSPKMKSVTPTKFDKITFGFGQKYDFTKPKNDNPGPGSYNWSGKLDHVNRREVTNKIN